jgi:transcriptional regulator with XRE-family HTH domain
MFVSYNMVNFGKSIKDIRKANSMTQLEVHKKTLIHIDTLRRIENGTTVPKYETLELLSKLFHIDLLEILKSKRIDSNLYSFYNKMDDILLNNNIADLVAMKNEFSILLSTCDKLDYLIDKNEIDQLHIFIEACQLFYTESPNELEKASLLIIEGLKVSNTAFSLETIAIHNYSEFELRLLLILSTIYMDLSHYQESILILNFLVDILSNRLTLSPHLIKLSIKTFTNLAYCYHLDDHHQNALRYANNGIDFAINNEMFYMLHNLYGRKAIAEHNLQDNNSNNSLNKCIHLLEISNQYELADKYKSIFKDKYNMIFND